MSQKLVGNDYYLSFGVDVLRFRCAEYLNILRLDVGYPLHEFLLPHVPHDLRTDNKQGPLRLVNDT